MHAVDGVGVRAREGAPDQGARQLGRRSAESARAGRTPQDGVW